MLLLQFDRDSVSRFVRRILFGMRRCSRHAHIVHLGVRLIVEIQDDTVQHVLVRGALLVRFEVDAKHAYVLVLELRFAASLSVRCEDLGTNETAEEVEALIMKAKS